MRISLKSRSSSTHHVWKFPFHNTGLSCVTKNLNVYNAILTLAETWRGFRKVWINWNQILLFLDLRTQRWSSDHQHAQTLLYFFIDYERWSRRVLADAEAAVGHRSARVCKQLSQQTYIGFPSSDKSRGFSTLVSDWKNIHIIMFLSARQLASTVQMTLRLSGDQ